MTRGRQDDGCWKWGILGCGGLGCMAVLAIVGIVLFIARSPIARQAVGSALQSQAAVQQLRVVGNAVDRYAADKKKYPNDLKELIPHYLPDERSLQISAEKSSPRIQYTRPAKDASADAIVLKVRIAPPLPFPDAPPWDIKRRKDGQLDGTEYEYTDKRGNRQRIDFGKQ
jgi:type II secretory pathway pseudopilin PulG